MQRDRAASLIPIYTNFDTYLILMFIVSMNTVSMFVVQINYHLTFPIISTGLHNRIEMALIQRASLDRYAIVSK